MKYSKFALVTLLSVSVVSTACSNKTESNTAAPTADAAKGDTKREKVSLSWFVNAEPNTNLPEASKDFVKQQIEQKFNVDLEVEYFPIGNDYNTKINTLLASKAPDMWRDANADGGTKYALDGLIADLTTFVTPATMPNYHKYWVTEEEIKGYRLQGQYVRAPIPFSKSSYRSYYIRKDWLDKLGLQIPKNYEEYLDVLRAFRNDDPDGNGVKDTYGFTTSGNGTGLGFDWPEYVKNGLTFASFLEDNKFVDIQTDLRIESVLNDILKVINEDLVDPDWFLNKATQHLEKAIQGKAGIILSDDINVAMDNNRAGIQFRTKELNPEANWVSFSMFPDTALRTMPAPSFPFLFTKSLADKDPEKIERTVEILDWLASEEGFVLTHYGLEGKHYTREGETLNLNLEAYEEDITKQGNFLKIWSFFTPETPQVYGLKIINPQETDRDREIKFQILSIPVRDNVGVSLTPPEGFDLGAFRKRQNELQIKAIFDDKSGENWPKYREELMTTYKGNDLFARYEELIKAGGKIK